MFGWFRKADRELEAAKKAFLGLTYKESKGGGPREVFWIGRSDKTRAIRVGVKFYERTYFLDAVEFARDLQTRDGWQIIKQP